MSIIHSPTKSGSDSNLPLLEDVTTDPIHGYKRRRVNDSKISIQNELKAFKEDIKNLLDCWKSDQDKRLLCIEKTLNEIKLSNIEIEKSMEFISNQYEEMSQKVTALETQCMKQEHIIDQLKDEVENLNRNAKITSIELRNAPCDLHETKQDLLKYIIKLCENMKLELNPTDIKDIYRIPGKPEANKPIIVSMSTVSIKQNVLKAAKTYNTRNRNNKLNAKDLGLQQTSPIYLSEHLTAKGNRLYFLARDLAKNNNYKYCWSSGGKVFVRKNEGMPAILIKSEEQILSLKKI